MLNFRFVNGKPPYGAGVPIFCIISILVRVDSHSSWKIERMSVVPHLTARQSRWCCCCTLITWSWEMMTMSGSRSPLFLALAHQWLWLHHRTMRAGQQHDLHGWCHEITCFVWVRLSGIAMVLLVYGPLRLNYCTCLGINKKQPWNETYWVPMPTNYQNSKFCKLEFQFDDFPVRNFKKKRPEYPE